MPWQLDWWDVIGEYYQDDDTGLMTPYYRTAFDLTPRQAGKTTVKLPWAFDRMLFFNRWPWAEEGGQAQLGAWTAQTGAAVRKKWLKEFFPQIKRSPMMKKIRDGEKGLVRAKGEEAMELRNGSGLYAYGNTEDAGHGSTIQFAVMDELFKDVDKRREQWINPAMQTATNGQRLMCSTEGNHKSVLLAQKVAQGRRAVKEGRDSGMAYIEYSADKDWVAAGSDTEEWWTWMPSLGHTATVPTIQADMEDLEDKEGEAERAYGNIRNMSAAGGTGFMSVDLLDACSSTRVSADPDGRLVLAVAAEPDLSMASVAVADDRGRCEIYETGKGVGWVEDELVEIVNDIAKNRRVKITYAENDPIAAIADSFSKQHRKPFSATQVLKACGKLKVALDEGSVSFRTDADLRDAVDGVIPKDTGARFSWDREYSASPVSPLYAATLALAFWDIVAEPDPFAFIGVIGR